MRREKIHIDAMLRHLGRAYYDSLHGRAAKSDVTMAVDQIAAQAGERSAPHAQVPRSSLDQAYHRVPRHHGRLHSRIRDVMTTEAVTVDRITPFKEIVELLVEHKISGVPVVRLGQHLGGVVTEGDLLKARDRRVSRRRNRMGMLRYDTDRARYLRLTAEQLMTSPTISIHPDASIHAAARLMSSHNVELLPVVDPDGTLVGLVSRRDLLNVFCIPDSDVALQVREVLDEIVPGESRSIKAAVRGGIVTLSGHAETVAERNSIAKAIDLAWDLDGVVDLIDHVTSPEIDLT
jgi:CBS domain-containing protein